MVATSPQVDLGQAAAGQRQLLCIAHSRDRLFEKQAFVEHLSIKETRPHHSGEDADDDECHDQLDEGEALR